MKRGMRREWRRDIKRRKQQIKASKIQEKRMKIKNRIEIDFDALPDEVVEKLALGIEQYIAANHREVRLHGACSSLDEETLTHEVECRSISRGATTGCTCGDFSGSSVVMADCPVHNRHVLPKECSE